MYMQRDLTLYVSRQQKGFTAHDMKQFQPKSKTLMTLNLPLGRDFFVTWDTRVYLIKNCIWCTNIVS